MSDLSAMVRKNIFKLSGRFLAAALCTAFVLSFGGCREISEEPVTSPSESVVISTEMTEGEFFSTVYESLNDDEKQLYDKICSAV